MIAARETDVARSAPRPEERDPAWTLLALLGVAHDREQSVGHRAVRHVGPDQHRRRGRAQAMPPSSGSRGTQRALALKTDGNGRYTYLDPRVGGRIAVAEAARNVACVGARPMAITNCLNFGNPTRPEVYYQLREAIAGMGEACRALGTPVTGGNVSLYNESPTGADLSHAGRRYGRSHRCRSRT